MPVRIGKLAYLYDAFGNKLRKRVYTNGTLTNQMDYTSGALYSTGPGGSPTLQYLATAEGRAVKNAEAYSYQYFLTDHLGNVRVVFADENNDGTAEVVQDNHYYPFGLPMSFPGGLVQAGEDNPFKYQCKEYQEDAFNYDDHPDYKINLDLYDFHARQYDPQLGRWHVPDPFINNVNPYLAMINNPISTIDPDGTTPDWCKKLWAWITGGKVDNNAIHYNIPYPKKAGHPDNIYSKYPGDNGGNTPADRIIKVPFGGGGGGSGCSSGSPSPNDPNITNRVSNQLMNTGNIPYKEPETNIGNYLYQEPYKITRHERGFKHNPQGQGGETWYYGVQRDKVGNVGHSLVRTPDGIIYEINHPDYGRTDGLKSWLKGGPKAVGYRYDMSRDADFSAFWNFGDGRKMVTWQSVNVPNPQASRNFFESWVGGSWDYNFFTNNGKHYIYQGLTTGKASINFSTNIPAEWPGAYSTPWYSPY